MVNVVRYLMGVGSRVLVSSSLLGKPNHHLFDMPFEIELGGVEESKVAC